mgnify:CR=1 FL=1
MNKRISIDIDFQIKGEKRLQIPSPKIETIIEIATSSSKPNLNFRPFSLTALPAIMQIKVKKTVKIVDKIRLSKEIWVIVLPINTNPSKPTKAKARYSKNEVILNFL